MMGQAVAEILRDHTGDDVAALGLVISTAITLQVSLSLFHQK